MRLGYLTDSSLVARRIAVMRGSLVASPDYVRDHGEPQAPEELLAHEALMQGTEGWRFLAGDKMLTIHPRGRFKADNGTALAAAALAGLGIAALPDFLVADHLASGALVRVMTKYPAPDAGLYVVRPPAANPARKISVLTELLIERFG
ncbi:hypothetical protein LLE64_05175 [Xanthomonas campestris pv. plantaginis]|nr:hypothetical protein [Xanthomonas campestris pv. plantaginis]